MDGLCFQPLHPRETYIQSSQTFSERTSKALLELKRNSNEGEGKPNLFHSLVRAFGGQHKIWHILAYIETK